MLTHDRVARPVPVAPPVRRRRPLRGERRAAVLLAAPALVLMAVFVLVPLIVAAVLAFVDWNALRATGEFVGWANFARVLPSSEFLRALGNTCVYIVITVPVTLGAALVVALGIQGLLRGRGFWRAAYFLPAAATLAAASIAWRWMFYPQAGVVDRTIGRFLGLTDWLGTPALALVAVALVGSWQSLGPAIVMFLAGLSGVPRHLHEAATLDGAGAVARFRHVTWPSIGPATAFALVVTSRDALRVFDQVKVMTDGGPMGHTETLAYLMWQRGVRFLDVGSGAVINLVLLAMVVVLVYVQLRFFGRALERAGSR